MKKIVDFGISGYSKKGRISSGQDKMDHVNGIGDYLGIVRIGNKNLMFTKTTSSGAHKHDGEIMINEVDFDVYSDGGIAVYYNLYKSDGMLDLQRAFNSPTIIKMLDSGKTLIEILNQLRVSYSYSTIERIIESDFTRGEQSIYPEDYDFERAIAEGDSYDKRRNIKREPVERLIATGIEREVFEDLIEVKRTTHLSLYQLGCEYREKREESGIRR